MDGTVRPGGSPPLLVGKYVEVEINGIERDDYYLVPRAALQSGNEVWIVRDGGTVHIVPVQVLQRTDDRAYVAGDLEDGQAAVTGGIRFTTEGMRVQTETGQNP